MRCDSTSSFRHRLFECERVAFVLRFVKAPLHHVADRYDAGEPTLLHTSERTFPFQERSFHFPRRNTPDDCDAFRQTLDDSTPPPIRTKLLA